MEIWLTNRQGEKTYNATVEKTGHLRLTEMKEGTVVGNEHVPLLRLPQHVWQMVVDAASETTPPTKKERVEAELDATKKHLEDMRRLVFDSTVNRSEEEISSKN